MESLVTAFVAAMVAEWGDKTQLLVILLAARHRRPVTILIGLLVAAAASSALAAIAGSLIAETITIRAMTLMVALALLFAGVSGLFRRTAPSIESGRMPLIAATIVLCLAAEFGDRSQFLTFALAGRFEAPGLAAAGATAGIFAAAIPAVLLGQRLPEIVPVRALRIGGAIAFLIVGFITATSALELS
jgi:putative Ca2+/H+ antiporter (TMEM165/GDT1 family)